MVKPTSEPNFGIYGWYWGQGQGTISPLLQGHMSFLFNGIQMAGPRLTPRTFRQGLFAMPRTGGAAAGKVASYEIALGAAADLPYDEYLAVGLSKLLDIEMLVMTVGGKERTQAEFAELFASAGLKLSRVVETPTPTCVIEAVPA